MADELFDGVLGGEEEKSEAAAAAETPAGAEAFAAAIAAIASRQDPGVARKTEVFLDEQTRLLETQRRHLEDEHACRLTHLHLAVEAAKRKRYTDRVRNGVYTGIALLVLALLVGVVRMTVDAISDDSLVFEGFTVPPDLVAQGASSEALANDFVTRMAAMRSLADRGVTESRQVRAAGANALKVQIPETGVSLDELESFLHRWLGHQTVLSGQVLDEPGGGIGIALDVQGSPPIEVHGPRAALEQLMQQAAEQVYGVLDPINYSVYLVTQGRIEESWQAVQRYARSHDLAALPPPDRATAYCVLSAYDPIGRRALADALVAADLDPRVTCAWTQAAGASRALGHDRAMVEFSRRALTTKRADDRAAERASYPVFIMGAHANIDAAMGDFSAVERDVEAVDQLRPYLLDLSGLYASRAQFAAQLHDETRSRQDLARSLVTGSADTDEPTAMARWYMSVSLGDWAQALDAAKALVADEEAQKSKAPSPESAAGAELALETQYDPLLAYAEAMTGDVASATALISQTPTDCYLCVRMRARIAAAAGDAGTADRWFAEAVRQAPDLPMAYYEWGLAFFARGDLAGAARELSVAHEKGPHFADPLKAWGDVLAKQGRRSDALAKYDEALKYAPNWAALRQARAAAAARTSA